ncbi:MAG: response regulator [Candidatus Scalindua sp.]|nr:response regulator [Candidatus Scalindua sp.]
MAEKTNKVLLVEDNPGDVRLVQELLAEADTTLLNIDLECADGLSAALERLSRGGIDLVLLDLSLPDSHGTRTFEKVHSKSPSTPIVIFSGMNDEKLAFEAVKKGAQDYLVKGQTDGNLLVHAIHYAVERNLVEQALCESESRYKSLVQLIPDVLYTLDPDGKFTFLNGAVRTLGYDPMELIGKHFSEIVDTDNVDAVSSSKVLPKYSGTKHDIGNQPKLFDERRTGERKTSNLEIQIRTKSKEDDVSGEEKCVKDEYEFAEVTSSGHYNMDVNNKGKQFCGTIGVIKDITDAKKIYEKNRLLTHAVEHNSSTIIITDASGTIEYINSRFTKLTGYTAEEVIGQTPRILKSGNTSSEKYTQLWDTITSGKEWHGEFCNKKKNGEIYWEHTSISHIRNSEGNITHFFAANEDITERKKMEEALMQSEKLKSIGTISAGVAHDFNNILAVISGKTQMLEMSYKENKELTDELGIIMKAARDGAEISKRMFKSINIGKDFTEFEPCHIGDLLDQAIEFTMPRWKNEAQVNGINYDWDKKGIQDVPATLCNPTELREVFINIINNSIDAMPDGGTITVKTRYGRSQESGENKRKFPDYELKDNFVEVTITDTGKGMTEEVKKKIFDPFFTAGKPEGTGLGMSTSYGIVIGHGGKIEVESNVGKGSTFTLQFPITIKTVYPISTPEQDQEHEARSKCYSILIVDDEQVICSILDELLSHDGHKTKMVYSGTDAIELIEREEFDLVLCDIAMPNISGYDVIKRLNELEKRPIIGIISGWGKELKPMHEEGVNVDFIAEKPFDFLELKKQINKSFRTK